MTPQAAIPERDYAFCRKSFLTIFGMILVILLGLSTLGYLTIHYESMMKFIFRNIRYTILFGAGFLSAWASPFQGKLSL
jgi:hypothetical protein